VFRRSQRAQAKLAARTEQRRLEVEAAALLAGRDPNDEGEDDEEDASEEEPDRSRVKGSCLSFTTFVCLLFRQGRFFAPPSTYDSTPAPSESIFAPKITETGDEAYARRMALSGQKPALEHAPSARQVPMAPPFSEMPGLDIPGLSTYNAAAPAPPLFVPAAPAISMSAAPPDIPEPPASMPAGVAPAAGGGGHDAAQRIDLRHAQRPRRTRAALLRAHTSSGASSARRRRLLQAVRLLRHAVEKLTTAP
jgi:hypothetical protein